MGNPVFPRRFGEMNLPFLLELGVGLLQSANLGFLRFKGTYQSITPPALVWSNRVAFIYQWGCALSLPILLLAWTMHRLKVVAFAYLVVALFLIGLGFSGKWSGVKVCLRRAILVGVWPLALLVVLPLAMPAALFLPFLASVWYFVYLNPPGPLRQAVDSGWLVQGIIYPACVVIVFYLVASICNQLRKTPVGTVVKILADVFRYVGIQNYRSALQDLVHESVRSVVETRPSQVLFLTHSLGSVIAVDYLRMHRNLLVDVPEVILITMGSPLRRLLATFFPDFFPDPACVVKEIKREFSNFRWINVYRPYDPIGRDLSVPSREIVSRSTEQKLGRWLGLPAHLGYWFDEKVFAEISKALHANAENPPAAANLAIRRVEMPTPGASTEYGWDEPGSIRGSIWSLRSNWYSFGDLWVRRLTNAWAGISALFVIIWNFDIKPGFATNFAMLGFLSYFFRDLCLTVTRTFLEISTCCMDRFPSTPVLARPEAARAALQQAMDEKTAMLKKVGVGAAICALIVISGLALQSVSTSGWSLVPSAVSRIRTNKFRRSVALSTDGKSLMVASNGVHVLDLAGTQSEKVLDAESYYQIVSQAGSDCIAAGDTQKLTLWNRGQKTDLMPPEREWLGLAVDCNENTIFAVGTWGLGIFNPTDKPVMFPHPSVLADISADGKYAAFCSGGSKLEVVLLPDNQTIERTTCGPWGRIAFSPDGTFLAYDSPGGIAILNLNTKEKKLFDACSGHTAFAVSSKATFLAVDCPLHIRIYDGATFKEVAHSGHYLDTVVEDQLIFSPDGKSLAIVSGQKGRVIVKKWKKAGLRQEILEKLEDIGLKVKVDEFPGSVNSFQ